MQCCLLWSKFVNTHLSHPRQWFSTLIPPSHEWLLTVDCISCLSGPMRLSSRYAKPDIHCRDRRYEWDGGIKQDITKTEKVQRKFTKRLRGHDNPNYAERLQNLGLPRLEPRRLRSTSPHAEEIAYLTEMSIMSIIHMPVQILAKFSTLFDKPEYPALYQPHGPNSPPGVE